MELLWHVDCIHNQVALSTSSLCQLLPIPSASQCFVKLSLTALHFWLFIKELPGETGGLTSWGFQVCKMNLSIRNVFGYQTSCNRFCPKSNWSARYFCLAFIWSCKVASKFEGPKSTLETTLVGLPARSEIINKKCNFPPQYHLPKAVRIIRNEMDNILVSS